MKLVNRDFYLNKLFGVVGTPDIKVIVGIRRSGKSKLLEDFMRQIRMRNPNANIIHINYNLPDYDHLLNYRDLYDYIRSRYAEGKDNFVMIDEIQMCNGFEKAVNWLHASEQYDIYI
ncbi:AAA family ATPase, partial [bacterium]|nr:AAA family ATPase [bacterium]